jgi:hypothetical protein
VAAIDGRLMRSMGKMEKPVGKTMGNWGNDEETNGKLHE